MKKILSVMSVVALLAATFVGCGSKGTTASKVNWPTGSVQLIVPAKAGGGTDVAARVFGSSMQKALGKPMVIVNQDSGGGSVACETVRNSKPDGNTILFYHSSMLVSIHTGLYDKSAIDDFTLLGVLPTGGSYALAVGTNSPYKSVKDLVAAAKEKPGKITMGVQTKGSTHFMAGLLMKDAGVEFKLVEAGSDADKLATLQGGNIDAALINTSGSKQYADAGRLRILATIAGNPERDPGAPDIPSLYELGYKNSVYGIDLIVLGPKGIDPAAAEKINAALGNAVKDKEVIDQLNKIKMPVEYKTLKDSAARLKEIDEKISTTAKALGIAK